MCPKYPRSKSTKKDRTDNQSPPFEIVEGETGDNDKQTLHVEQAKERLEKNVLGENEPEEKKSRRKYGLTFEGNNATVVGPRGISRKLPYVS